MLRIMFCLCLMVSFASAADVATDIDLAGASAMFQTDGGYCEGGEGDGGVCTATPLTGSCCVVQGGGRCTAGANPDPTITGAGGLAICSAVQAYTPGGLFRNGCRSNPYCGYTKVEGPSNHDGCLSNRPASESCSESTGWCTKWQRSTCGSSWLWCVCKATGTTVTNGDREYCDDTTVCTHL